ncbi:MAG: pilus assembly protein TadG-related protein [Acidimicrobiia bacterium]
MIARIRSAWTRRASSRRRQDGFVGVQVVGWCLILILAGGIALDLWRGYSAQRSASNAADSAAAAGATALDEQAYRKDGTVQLVPLEARDRACTMLRRQDPTAACDSNHIAVTVDTVRVAVDRPFQFTLMRWFVSERNPTVRATSTASPR